MSTPRISSPKSHGMMIALTLSLVLGISMGIGIVTFGGWEGLIGPDPDLPVAELPVAELPGDILPQVEDDDQKPDNSTEPETSLPSTTDTGTNSDVNINPAPDIESDKPSDTHTPEGHGPPSPSQPAAPNAGEVRSYYDQAGNPPVAPGLTMKSRTFRSEPEKIVYLTFDDGPYPHSTPKIVKILQDEGIKATFFVLGVQVEKYPEQLRMIFDSGNGIGNHSYSHIYQELYVSPQAFLDNIKHCEDVIDQTIGIRPKIIRAPGGSTNFSVTYYNLVDQEDYLVYDWNSSSDDSTAKLLPADKLVKNVINTAQGKDRVIVLMHDMDTKTTTIDALPQIIHYFKEHGYEFGVLGPDAKPIMFQSGFTK